MAVIEQALFNKVAFENFTPQVTKERSSDFIKIIFFTTLVVTIGFIVHHELKKRENMKQKMAKH